MFLLLDLSDVFVRIVDHSSTLHKDTPLTRLRSISFVLHFTSCFCSSSFCISSFCASIYVLQLEVVSGNSILLILDITFLRLHIFPLILPLDGLR